MIPIRIKIIHYAAAVVRGTGAVAPSGSSFIEVPLGLEFDWNPDPRFWLDAGRSMAEAVNGSPLSPEHGHINIEAFNASVPDCENEPRANIMTAKSESRADLVQNLCLAAEVLRQQACLADIAANGVSLGSYPAFNDVMDERVDTRLQALAGSLAACIDPAAKQDKRGA